MALLVEILSGVAFVQKGDAVDIGGRQGIVADTSLGCWLDCQAL